MKKLNTKEFNELFLKASKELNEGNTDSEAFNSLWNYIKPYIKFIARGTDIAKLDITVEEQLVSYLIPIIKSYNPKKSTSAHSYLTYALKNKKNTILSNWYERGKNKITRLTTSAIGEDGSNLLETTTDERTGVVEGIEREEYLQELHNRIEQAIESFLIEHKGEYKGINAKGFLKAYCSGKAKNPKGREVTLITKWRKYVRENREMFVIN